jgi:hypothetical protein
MELAGPTSIPTGAVVMNHGVRWMGGEIFMHAFPDDPNQDPVLNNLQGPVPGVFLGAVRMPELGQFHPTQILSQYTPGNLFFVFSVPVDANAFGQLVPGQTYRIVLTVLLPPGLADHDSSDNWVSTNIRFFRR